MKDMKDMKGWKTKTGQAECMGLPAGSSCPSCSSWRDFFPAGLATSTQLNIRANQEYY